MDGWIPLSENFTCFLLKSELDIFASLGRFLAWAEIGCDFEILGACFSTMSTGWSLVGEWSDSSLIVKKIGVPSCSFVSGDLGFGGLW